MVSPHQLCEPIDPKPATGLEPSPPPPGARLKNCPKVVLTLKDKKKLDLGDSSTFKSCVDFGAECDYLTFGESLDKDTGSQQDPITPTNMYGRILLQSQERASAWERSLRTEIQQSAGNRLDHRLSLAIWKRSLPTFTYVIISHCGESLLTFYDRYLWFDPALSSGDLPLLESHEQPGTKLVYVLTLKIPVPSGGAATQVRKLLSSMNFVELSTWPTSSGGWTGILSRWRLKEEQDHCAQQNFGSPQTSSQSSGTRM